MRKRFFFRILLYLAPLLVYLTGATGAAAYAGEFLPLRQVVALQAGAAPVLYGRAYRDNYFAYKLLAAQLRKPEVLSIGSSRMLAFRSMFFNKKSSAFFNAAHAAQSIYAVHDFVRALDRSELPSVLIIALDHPWFNASSHYAVRPQTSSAMNDERWPDSIHMMSVSQNIVADMAKGAVKVDKLLTRAEPVHGIQAIGLNAIMNGMGFRNDGSYQYGADILTPPSFESKMAEGFNDLRENVDSHFVTGSELSQESLGELEALLKFAKEHGIFVIGFSPPYAPTIYAEMMADGRHTYIPNEVIALEALFRHYDFGYFDFSDAAQLGAVEEDMIDAFHASEFINLRMYIRMLKALPDVLGPYSDLTFLEPLAQHPPMNRFELFGNQF
jgi:hypothetical protein